MGKSEAFADYKLLAANLRQSLKKCLNFAQLGATLYFCSQEDLKPLVDDEQGRKAFFINLYNVLMIHALVAQEVLPEAPTKVQVCL